MNLNRYLENPLFFKWIFNPSPDINEYWELYLKHNPRYREEIIKFKFQIETNLQVENRSLTESEKVSLAIKIAGRLELEDKKKSQNSMLWQLMQYAAIGLISLLVGGSIVYMYMSDKQPQLLFDNVDAIAGMQEPVLIMGDSNQIPLKQGELHLKYSQDGKVVLNGTHLLSKDNIDAPPEMNTLIIPYGSRSVITLADNTIVWLNAGSRLIFPARFVDDKREVFLVGEAFFEVKENKKQPFVVKTRDVKVEVLGTRFNLSAYPEDNSVQTVLTNGTINLKKSGDSENEKGVILIPGQMATYNKEAEVVSTQMVKVDDYILWTKGLFSFTKTDFNRIIKKLERYYNVSFQFEDPFTGGIQISGKLDVTKERSEVFRYLESITGLHIIKINEKTYLIK